MHRLPCDRAVDAALSMCSVYVLFVCVRKADRARAAAHGPAAGSFFVPLIDGRPWGFCGRVRPSRRGRARAFQPLPSPPAPLPATLRHDVDAVISDLRELGSDPSAATAAHRRPAHRAEAAISARPACPARRADRRERHAATPASCESVCAGMEQTTSGSAPAWLIRHEYTILN